MGFGYKAGWLCKERSLIHKSKSRKVQGSMWTDNPYEWVQGLGWGVSGKSELGESLEVIRDSDFPS